jgi:hypothetical protein
MFDFYGYMGMERVVVSPVGIPHQEAPTGSPYRFVRVAAAAAVLSLPPGHAVKQVGTQVPAAEVGVRTGTPIHRTIADQVSFIKSEIGLNMTELADVLRVRRPTVYAWIGGRETLQPHHEARVQQIYDLSTRWAVLASTRNLKGGIVNGQLFELLCAEQLDKTEIVSAMRQIAGERMPSSKLASARIYRKSLDRKQLSEETKRRRLSENLGM